MLKRMIAVAATLAFAATAAMAAAESYTIGIGQFADEIIKCASVASQFDEIEINAPEGFEGKIAYNDNGVDLVFSQKTDNNTAQNEISSPQTGDTSHVVMAFTAFVLSLAGILTASFASKIKSDRIR